MVTPAHSPIGLVLRRLALASASQPEPLVPLKRATSTCRSPALSGNRGRQLFRLWSNWRAPCPGIAANGNCGFAIVSWYFAPRHPQGLRLQGCRFSTSFPVGRPFQWAGTMAPTFRGCCLRTHNSHAVVVAVSDVDVARSVHLHTVGAVHGCFTGGAAIAVAAQPSACNGW